MLRCPHCHLALERDHRRWACAGGHSFDIARQGYVNLLAGRRTHDGDTAAMLDARSHVLAAGHLDVVTDGVTEACRGLPPGALVEVGAGTAHHLAALRRALGTRSTVAMDVSAAAAKRAARSDSQVTAVVADIWEPWPLRERVAAAVLAIFAPRNVAEATRVLVPGGLLVVVTPADDHLAELREVLGLLRVEADKARRLTAQTHGLLEHVDTREVRTTRVVDRFTARTIALMGPSAHHLDEAAVSAELRRLPERFAVTVAVHVHRFRRPGASDSPRPGEDPGADVPPHPPQSGEDPRDRGPRGTGGRSPSS